LVWRDIIFNEHYSQASKIEEIELLFLLVFFLFVRCLYAADNEVIFLTIEENLLERVELISEDSDPETIIASYYDLLPVPVSQEIKNRQKDLEKLLPDYEVAYLAADSAEMAEVRSEMDSKWARILVLHSEYFSAEVMLILNTAYVAKFGDLLPENFNPQDAE
tara:strand:- start:237 stop:725 length:489 start_codon:yes stop_codon:yes gene_type:complete